MNNVLNFQFENLNCIMQSDLDTISVPERNLTLSFNKINSFSNLNVVVGYNNKGEKCEIYELEGFIHIGCISLLKSSFENQLKNLNKKIKLIKNGKH